MLGCKNLAFEGLAASDELEAIRDWPSPAVP